ncbi:MAG: MFS transporter [Myxococcota bacterium]|nr:MFS transporter [Myxococcota bacterium]
MERSPVSLTHLVGVSLPAVPLFGLMMPTVVFMPALYTEQVGLELGLVGTVFMVAKLWDVLSDPLFGYAAETVRLPFGRRRPWIVLSVPVLLFAVYRIFVPAEDAGAAYLMFWLVVFYAGWTMIFLSLLAWASELSQDSHERSRVMGAVQMANVTGMIAIMALAALSDRVSGGDAVARAETLAWCVIVMLPLFVALMVRVVPEREARPGPRLDFSKTARAMWESAPLRHLILSDLLAGLMIGLGASLLLFYATHTLRLGSQGSLLLLVSFASNLAFIPAWIWISGRLGKSRTMAFAGAYAAIAHSLFLVVPSGDFFLAAAAMALVGLSGGALQFLPRSILSDIIDQAEAEGGGRHEAAYFALLTATYKSGMALAVGLGLSTLAFLGFDPRAADTGGSAESIRTVLFAYPAVFGLGIALMMHRFPLGRESDSVLREPGELVEG